MDVKGKDAYTSIIRSGGPLGDRLVDLEAGVFSYFYGPPAIYTRPTRWGSLGSSAREPGPSVSGCPATEHARRCPTAVMRRRRRRSGMFRGLGPSTQCGRLFWIPQRERIPTEMTAVNCSRGTSRSALLYYIIILAELPVAVEYKYEKN